MWEGRPVRRALAAVYRTGRAAAAGFGRHACSQLAAAISYRVLFSLVPFVALVFSVLELVLPEETRANVMDWLFGLAPGSDVESAVKKTVVHPGLGMSLGGLVAVVALRWAATGMMASIRIALGIVWSVERRSYARGKLRDVGLVALASLLLLGGFVVSVVVRLLAQVGDDLSDAVGLHGAWGIPGTVAQIAGSLALYFVAFVAVYSTATPDHMGLAAIWPSALLGAVAVEALIEGYAVYLGRFSDFHTVYGPLAAVFAF